VISIENIRQNVAASLHRALLPQACARICAFLLRKHLPISINHAAHSNISSKNRRMKIKAWREKSKSDIKTSHRNQEIIMPQCRIKISKSGDDMKINHRNQGMK